MYRIFEPSVSPPPPPTPPHLPFTNNLPTPLLYIIFSGGLLKLLSITSLPDSRTAIKGENSAFQASRLFGKSYGKDRSRRSQMFFKIIVLKCFATFTGKRLCWNLFLIKLFSREYCEILKNNFLYRTTPVAASEK